eukprot:718832_1
MSKVFSHHNYQTMENGGYHPGIQCASRDTKRTPSIIISSKEITLSHDFKNEWMENANEQQAKRMKSMKANPSPPKHIEHKQNEEEEEEQQQDPLDHHLTPTSIKPNNDYYYAEHDDLCSITSQQSQFFHPRNYHPEFGATCSFDSEQSVAATIDEFEFFSNMNELHHYDKHKQLGTGTDAHVYEVVDRRDKSHVAMKLTKRKSGRYRTEIHLLHQLRTCKYVIKLLKVLEDASVYVLILEQAPMTLEMLLHERCTERPMQEAVGKEIISDVMKGIGAIHNLGFVHKDIKPENILIFADRIDRKLEAKIADFGFATRAQPPVDIINSNQHIPKQTLSEFVQRVGDKCGTPGFWAPELVAGLVALEHAFKIDVFSAGVTLYRMICNEMPFGLFETWDVKEQGKLAKLKPNFQVVSWISCRNKMAIVDPKQKIDYIRKLAKNNLTKDVSTLLRGMLRIRPHKRMSVSDCLRAPFFQ